MSVPLKGADYTKTIVLFVIVSVRQRVDFLVAPWTFKHRVFFLVFEAVITFNSVCVNW